MAWRAGQAISHYLNQCWLVYWHIYASLGLNELMKLNSPKQWNEYVKSLCMSHTSIKHNHCLRPISIQYRNSHHKDKTVMTILSLSWISPYLERQLLYTEMWPWIQHNKLPGNWPLTMSSSSSSFKHGNWLSRLNMSCARWRKLETASSCLISGTRRKCSGR